MAAAKTKNWSHFLEFAVVRMLFGILSLAPFKVRSYFIYALFRLIFILSKSFRNRIQNNLYHAFPEKSQLWKNNIAKKNVLYLARMMSEFIQNPKINERFFNTWFRFDPDLNTVKKNLDQGGILILGHLGSWEWKGIAVTHISDSPLYVLAKRQRNPWANKFIEKNRGCQNINLVYTDENPRKALKLLKSGALVAFIADQDAGPEAEFYDFFHRKAATYHGPALFARMSKAPLHFMWSWHDEKGRLVTGIETFLPPSIDAKKEPHLWDRQFTEKWVAMLENKARMHPDDYYWLHNRWKSRPKS